MSPESGAGVQQRPRPVHDQFAKDLERAGRMRWAVPIGGHHARILEGFGKLDTPAGGPGYHVAVSFVKGARSASPHAIAPPETETRRALSHSAILAPPVSRQVGSSNTANRSFAEELETDTLQDPAFKRLFCHPKTMENVVRRYAPTEAEGIDFATLEELNTELVGEALVRRYPDMLWTARSTDGSSQVVILLEFQATKDPLMPLRIAIYHGLPTTRVVGTTV